MEPNNGTPVTSSSTTGSGRTPEITISRNFAFASENALIFYRPWLDPADVPQSGLEPIIPLPDHASPSRNCSASSSSTQFNPPIRSSFFEVDHSSEPGQQFPPTLNPPFYDAHPGLHSQESDSLPLYDSPSQNQGSSNYDRSPSIRNEHLSILSPWTARPVPIPLLPIASPAFIPDQTLQFPFLTSGLDSTGFQFGNSLNSRSGSTHTFFNAPVIISTASDTPADLRINVSGSGPISTIVPRMTSPAGAASLMTPPSQAQAQVSTRTNISDNLGEGFEDPEMPILSPQLPLSPPLPLTTDVRMEIGNVQLDDGAALSKKATKRSRNSQSTSRKSSKISRSTRSSTHYSLATTSESEATPEDEVQREESTPAVRGSKSGQTKEISEEASAPAKKKSSDVDSSSSTNSGSRVTRSSKHLAP